MLRMNSCTVGPGFPGLAVFWPSRVFRSVFLHVAVSSGRIPDLRVYAETLAGVLVGARYRDVSTGAVVDEVPGSVFVLLCSIFSAVGYVPTE